MTRTQLVGMVAERLGDSSTDFVADVLDGFFDRVLEEMATNDCLRSLRKVANFSFTAGDDTYSTRTITGLASPDFPVDLIRVMVPAWGSWAGMLTRLEEDAFLKFRLQYVDSTGALVTGQPAVWTLYPNEQQLYIAPAPAAEYVITNGVEVQYIAPPTAIASGADITEVRREHLSTIIYGMIAHGANFQDETLPDLASARPLFEAGMARMRAQNQKEPMRDHRIRYRDY